LITGMDKFLITLILFATNAYTESINNIIKHIERIGRGYSFDFLRAKVLFGNSATIKPNDEVTCVLAML